MSATYSQMIQKKRATCVYCVFEYMSIDIRLEKKNDKTNAATVLTMESE